MECPFICAPINQDKNYHLSPYNQTEKITKANLWPCSDWFDLAFTSNFTCIMFCFVYRLQGPFTETKRRLFRISNDAVTFPNHAYHCNQGAIKIAVRKCAVWLHGNLQWSVMQAKRTPLSCQQSCSFVLQWSHLWEERKQSTSRRFCICRNPFSFS